MRIALSRPHSQTPSPDHADTILHRQPYPITRAHALMSRSTRNGHHHYHSNKNHSRAHMILRPYRCLEQAKLMVQPQLGFGALGLPTFGVPPDAELEFTVHLINIIEVCACCSARRCRLRQDGLGGTGLTHRPRKNLQAQAPRGVIQDRRTSAACRG